jgi:hypothetical protein
VTCALLVLLFVIILFGILGTIIPLVNQCVHKEMTLGHCKQWDYSSYKWFRINFARHEWEINHNYRSVFDYPTDSQCHASIIRFNGKGMVLGPIDFFRSQRFLKNYTDFKRTYGLWNDGYKKHDSKMLMIIR